MGWVGVLALVLVTGGCATPAPGQWLQWGGPQRNFVCDSTGLADQWPEDGPRVVWRRDITSGHSAIAVDGGRIYTMCRRDDQDVVIALSADTGKPAWETAYDAPTKPDMLLDFGPGPHATPLIVGDRVFTIGGMAQFHCLDKKTGEILWAHDLMEEMGTSHLQRGYGASPIAYGDTVIVLVGGRRGDFDAGVAAFKQDTGEIVWKSEKFSGGYPTPLVVQFNGEDHLILALRNERIGLDPAGGETRWKTTVDMQSAGTMATPVWIPPDRFCCSAGYGGGSRLFQLTTDAGEHAATELWHTLKMKIHHANVIQIDDFVVGSSGDFGPAFMMALDLETGKPLWRQRGFAKSTLLLADGKLIILDEQGNLALATATRAGLEIHSKVKVLQELSWTAPTLVGTRLYLRDHHTIMCLDLSAAANL